ncbi:DUF1330 domain-containing protein [Rhodophyticola sp. CCM32]|uniref:DUF1330 domain-containing protein n=1 Tax=Rhodophyticola sp. CCM32 TaxID=2916397 RepID=UPI00107F107C|nr:DUF1330 domain-containing protein [Rhodophyticola sp. CCM32]QBY02424.1 DUF1330 domain-containing protein [Rhodophyticola sp. CCM32]
MINAFATLTITDPEQLATYRAVAAGALAKHGGQVAAASPDITRLEGGDAAPDMAALLQFPDRDSAMAWINDPDLADIHARRRGAGQSTIILLG